MPRSQYHLDTHTHAHTTHLRHEAQGCRTNGPQHPPKPPQGCTAGRSVAAPGAARPASGAGCMWLPAPAAGSTGRHTSDASQARQRDFRSKEKRHPEEQSQPHARAQERGSSGALLHPQRPAPTPRLNSSLFFARFCASTQTRPEQIKQQVSALSSSKRPFKQAHLSCRLHSPPQRLAAVACGVGAAAKAQHHP